MSDKIIFISIGDKRYPSLLREIPDPPKSLYVRGDVSLLGNEIRRIGVVGTRKVTEYGKDVTRRLTRDLVKAGYSIVSGMASGVDTVAHQTAIENNGVTIAVLGAGIDVIYPTPNQNLYWNIIKKYGCVISEFPPGKITSKVQFASRNRIISGISQGVVVTEGGEFSGSLITASCALDQGREVFAVPGPITSKFSKGPAFLLKNGAKMVTGISDILEELPPLTSGVK
ncbi:DNA protecting protein DprA [Candidatus Gottesmanbacteria bacterium RIFCSPHIGHO2_01_FULL_39_10]|uniref:DNA protecting protein DprA n=1 Tax=Candidatus Gottesmanbacteria bacterium RIFCSPHIGHO2_01_FULL_39_10 TaxID=1798375 RepID=A0A1F5ZQ22_9BACT|nr:MAG: DNA protecting protein DprA [Candidatus Gottesmanbacteria bacterium RIFCSPHIGHO2_01_FULL_39_10]